MPCTFSHPLAVVPLRRGCPERLNFAALVIGSMSPDFGYYILQFPVARFAHTALGTLIVCLPTGLIALGLFYLLRRPLCFVLPQPHRSAMTPLVLRQPSFSLRSFFVAALSILLGAWTHTVWDSFTHDDGWAVERLAILRAAVIHIGTSSLPVSYVLQQASTFGAGALLVVVYFRWLRRQQPTATRDTSDCNRRRYLLIVSSQPSRLLSLSPQPLAWPHCSRGIWHFGFSSSALASTLLQRSSHYSSSLPSFFMSSTDKATIDNALAS